jgi:nicotinate-nucleotide adenylyltransferase
MKTGLFFGTFNPVHSGHIRIARYFTEEVHLDRILFIISPHNPLKKKTGLLDAEKRLEMVRLAISGYKNFEVSDIEFHLSQPSYTYITLDKIKEKFPQDELLLLMGSDSLSSIEKWKNYQYILENFTIYVYPRLQGRILAKYRHHPHIRFFDAPMINISATDIRYKILTGKSVKELTTPEVSEYLLKNGIYR